MASEKSTSASMGFLFKRLSCSLGLSTILDDIRHAQTREQLRLQNIQSKVENLFNSITEEIHSLVGALSGRVKDCQISSNAGNPYFMCSEQAQWLHKVENNSIDVQGLSTQFSRTDSYFVACLFRDDNKIFKFSNKLAKQRDDQMIVDNTVFPRQCVTKCKVYLYHCSIQLKVLFLAIDPVMHCDSLFIAPTQESVPGELQNVFFYLFDESADEFYLQSARKSESRTFKNALGEILTLNFNPLKISGSTFPLFFQLGQYDSDVLRVLRSDLIKTSSQSGSRTLSQYLQANYHFDIQKKVSSHYVSIDSHYSDLQRTLSDFQGLMKQSDTFQGLVWGFGSLGTVLIVVILATCVSFCCCPDTLAAVLRWIGRVVVIIISFNCCCQGCGGRCNQCCGYTLPPEQNIPLQ